ncbi:hypothetical protein BIW11_02457 [Tropilaelaps mercedesae]|uniref:Uncharacterized protein n=1 Tax=Tropilaelaps mercedesae TaxID=418985 RepID=A0A1V9Y2X6_9ACAR|nr:hypothetical protein BIW11_02457 [Tropilaelaps mercedesae]
MKAKVRMSITGTQNGTGPSGDDRGLGVTDLAEDRARKSLAESALYGDSPSPPD